MSQHGTIVGFEGTTLSGLGYLFIQDDEGLRIIPCDNAVTVRALDDCFENVICGMQVNNDAIRGRRIQFETDWSGLLEWFAPLGDDSK